ncbi:MAG: type IV pilus modification protein PilV [Candidatus Nitrotoga sp.]|nr:type IV pilus modification protein PilV [Candidatus Nitrotoga sp.]
MRIHNCNSEKIQTGFAMLEVLVSLALIAIVLLGQAGLQSSALKLNKGATLRMQAVLLSDEITERIENNKVQAVSYEVAAASTPAAIGTDCATNSCTSTALASYDLALWQTRVAAALPGATWQITRLPDTPSSGMSTFTIVLTWQDRRDNANTVNYATTGTGETISLTSVKVV